MRGRRISIARETIVTQGELSVTLELDSSGYAPSDTLTARLAIHNDDPGSPGVLSFSTGQTYDLEIRDGNGSVVYLWSRGKTFPQIVSELKIEDQKEYVVSAQLPKLPYGAYVLKAWFTSDGPPRVYSASARFQIE
jgi:hypothetical protein